MRLLALELRWPPRDCTFIYRRLEALAALGVEVSVATACDRMPDARQFPVGDIVALPARRASAAHVESLVRNGLRTIARRPRRLARLGAVARRFAPRDPVRFLKWWARALPFGLVDADIVHFEWNNSALEFAWLPEFLGARSVVSCRGRLINLVPHLPGQSEYRRQLAGSLQEVDAVHGVSRRILDEAAALGMPPSKGAVVYTAVDGDFFCPAGTARAASDGPLRLVTVGALVWRKGYEYMVMALAELVSAGVDATLEIVGEGPDKDRIVQTAADLAVQDRIRFLGRQPPQAVRDQLRRSDVFVLASLSEGVANVVVEAMAVGLPVVTTDCGGMAEAVTDGVEGFVVPRREWNAMARAIARLAGSAELRQTMGEASRRRALEQFSLENQAREFLGIYDRLLGETTP